MQTTIQGLELSVAILMEDIQSAKEMASALRHHDIFAQHYQSLEDFWVATNLEAPDLCIVDVARMSQGAVQFRNHPKVLNGTLNYVFFSKENTKVLLQSTLGTNPYGFIQGDTTLIMQINNLVARRRKEIAMAREKEELEARVQRLLSRSNRLLADRSEAEQFQANYGFIKNFCAAVESQSESQDFTQALMNQLEHWDDIDSYGIYELNQSGQKLIAPELAKKKHHPFPSLWLGQVNGQGIEPFAQEMAVQVTNDLFETRPVMLKIHAANNGPDLLIFLRPSEVISESFPWSVLESGLSSCLRRLRLQRETPKYVSQFLPMWEALDDMDRIHQGGVANTDMSILCLNLIPLTETVKKRRNNKFYWSAFFNDFFLQLSGRLQKSSKLSLMGPWQVIFFIPKENLEIEYKMLQAFVRQFCYWKFFEDNSQVLSEEMYPTMKLIPASSAHYLKLFGKEFEETSNDLPVRKHRENAALQLP